MLNHCFNHHSVKGSSRSRFFFFQCTFTRIDLAVEKYKLLTGRLATHAAQPNGATGRCVVFLIGLVVERELLAPSNVSEGEERDMVDTLVEF